MKENDKNHVDICYICGYTIKSDDDVIEVDVIPTKHFEERKYVHKKCMDDMLKNY